MLFYVTKGKELSLFAKIQKTADIRKMQAFSKTNNLFPLILDVSEILHIFSQKSSKNLLNSRSDAGVSTKDKI